MQTLSESAQLLAALTRQNDLLQQILDHLKQPRLGLGDAPASVKIYANRSNGCLWYSFQDGVVSPIAAAALTGYLTDLKFEEVERRGRSIWKLLTHIRADRPYIIESGYESHFSKGLLMAIASLTPEQAQQPLTLYPQPGSDEAVLFCRVFVGSELIKTPYDDQTDWRSVSQQALNVVRAAAL